MPLSPIIARMFDNRDPAVVRSRDDPVLIDTHKLWPVSCSPSACSARRGIPPWPPGGVDTRRTSGGWLAVVEIEAHSGDGSAAMAATLLVPAGAVRRVDDRLSYPSGRGIGRSAPPDRVSASKQTVSRAADSA